MPETQTTCAELPLHATICLVVPEHALQEVQPVPPRHPRIGLVLEGGAALGLAQVGVIKWLEEHRIPVSYVAGTSMGGLVGGLYATGYSPAGMQHLLDGIAWDDVLKGQTPFSDLTYRRKEDEQDYPGIRWSSELPAWRVSFRKASTPVIRLG